LVLIAVMRITLAVVVGQALLWKSRFVTAAACPMRIACAGSITIAMSAGTAGATIASLKTTANPPCMRNIKTYMAGTIGTMDNTTGSGNPPRWGEVKASSLPVGVPCMGGVGV